MYQQIKKKHIIPITSLMLAVAEIFLISSLHGDISQFVNIQYYISIALFLSLVMMSAFSYLTDLCIYNYEDIRGLFIPLPRIDVSENVKKILVFNWRDIRHPWAGGAELYIHELAKRWVGMGYSVTLLTARSKNNPSTEIIDGVRIMRHGGAFTVYVWSFLYFIVHLKNQVDIIIDSENGIPFFTPLYSRKKIFLLIHHVHQQVFRTSLNPPFSWIASFLEAKIMPLVYRKIHVITVSPSSKADIIDHQLTNSEPSIVYCGVNTLVYKPGEKNKNPLVVYIGRLKNYKSLHIFIHSAAQLIQKIPDIRFIIAGSGEEKGKLLDLADKLNVSSYIDFVGKVNDEEKIQLYRKAWVFVNPSLMEGWGITSIEANACGTPVVASNVSGLRDSVYNPHSGFLVPYGNVDEFTKQIELLIVEQINPTENVQRGN